MRCRHLMILVLIPAVLAGAGCGGAVSDEYEIERQPYRLEPVSGDDDLMRVILTPSAVERLGIETAIVEDRGAWLSIPADAIFLDAHGDFWVYTNPEPQTFVRAPIEIARENADVAILRTGPAPGTVVVTVGVPELYGSETEFGT
jgi:hypothetical protein